MSLFRAAVLMVLLASTAVAGYTHARAGAAEAIDFMLNTFLGMAGSDGQRHFVKGHLSEWEADPLTLGAYSAARPGYFTTRVDLARPLGEHVFFAGETTASPYAALCSGAHLSGERSAAVVADQLTASGACSSCDARGRQRTRLIGDTE